MISSAPRSAGLGLHALRQARIGRFVRQQIDHLYPEGVGESDECFKAWVFVPVFALADPLRRHVQLRRECILRQVLPSPHLTDSAANQALDLRR